MVVRRIRDHVAEHNWFAVAIDLAIVVVGVFLGTQANDWNQNRIERQQARAYRAMLIADLQTNQANVADRAHYYRWVREHALATLADLAKPSAQLGEQFLIDAYQATQIQPWGIKRNTYDQILSVGAMGTLGNALLRDQVANYYVAADVTGPNLAASMPYRETLRRIMPYAVQQRIRSRCAEVIVGDDRGEVRMVVPDRCSLALDGPTIRRAVKQVHDWPQLDLDLNRQIVDLDQKLVSTDIIARRASKLQAQLKQAGG